MCFKNFCERVLRAYAAIMRTLFPTYCVKFKTLNYLKTKHGGSRKNENATLFLPGVEKELKAIEKLQLGEAALKTRVWSCGTELELLKKGNFALISRVKTEEALNLVVEQGYINPICEAFKVYTPSKNYLLNLIRHWDRAKLFAVIAGVPSAFDSLTAAEILGVDEKRAYKDKELWVVAQELIKAKPEKWTSKFINEVMKIVPSRLNDEAKATLELCVRTAMEKNIDIANSMAYLMVFHPNLYVMLRIALAKDAGGHKLISYVRVMFPQFISKLGKNFGAIYAKNGPSTWAQSEMKFFEETEAAVWLYFALRPATIDLVIDNLSEIKTRVSEKTFQAVEDDVFTFATGAREVLALMKFYKDDAKKQEELREKLLKAASPATLREFYPFNGWNAEQAEKAVRAMAVGKTLPEDLSALSEKLQAAAIEELEIQSEIAVICHGTCGEKETLMQQKLHPRSEAVLVSHYYGTLESYVPQYIQNNRMSESAFKVLVSNIRDSQNYGIEECVPKLVRLHAERWGLSEKNYKDLMQSAHYSKLAAVLKKYCKVESRQPSFEDGV